ncbi:MULTISPECIES: cytochrome c oxidase subunit 3 [Bizionia]|uniref:Nitric oxide reductase n=1 Tax=Bizionia algoritergicola TaxID=291187 RepID=A0A5D0R1C3_9FLAO|nr:MULTISPECIES: cytochrome c oxidase subunit 3 [Bizionia]OBX24402.1 nitric oxide reductase [Bizionia sp. APA-3]TYB75323.1 nitric oxide reductase [Bizionia algoritergicola]
MSTINPEHHTKIILYPPGGILMWIIIYLELITFGGVLIAMVLFSKDEPDLFHQSRLLLNTSFGTINTLFLLISGFFMALTVSALKAQNIQKSKLYLKLTMLGGLLFLGLKTIEYMGKIDLGLTMGYNTFFSFYWMLTLFHVIHVLVGLVILASVLRTMIKKPETLILEDVEASATFWHMCDLIWLLLFPLIYLVF